MLRRILILLLVALMPLQAFASVHMGLSAARQQMALLDVLVPTPHAQHHAHDHAMQHAVSPGHSHDAHPLSTPHNCATCDICMPPFAVELNWPPLPMAAVVVPAAPVSEVGTIPLLHDRPPRA